MLDFEVGVSPAEFDVTSGGSVVGPIWVRLAGVDFPEPGWPDFPAKLLGGWLTTLSDLETAAPAPAVLHFMEGPYELEVTPAGGPAWLLRARQDGEPVTESTADSPAELLAPVRAAASRTLVACRERGWQGPDVRYLSWFTGD